MSIVNPQNFNEWKKIQEEMLNFIITNKKLPANTDFPFISNHSDDYSEMIKVFAVGAVSFIPVAGGPLSIIMDGIWSHALANNDTSLALWNSFQLMIKNMIDSGIESYDKEVVIGKVAGAKTYVTKFYSARTAWEKTPNNATAKKEVNDAYDDCEDVVRALLVDQGDLRKASYAYQELGAFTALATTHIILLKDGIKFGKKWGMSVAKIEEYSVYLSKIIPEYIKHAKISYQAGEVKIRSITNVDGVTKFDRLQSFRGYCARFVFDYINVWTVFDEITFANGAYLDHVRYIYGGVSGRPIDITKSCSNSSPYYFPAIEVLEKFFLDKEMDLYRKELKRVSIVNDNYWVYSIQPFFNDPAESGGEHAGEKAGNQVRKGGYIFNFPSSSCQTTLITDYDVQPRLVSLPQTTSPNMPGVTMNLGYSEVNVDYGYDTFLDRYQASGIPYNSVHTVTSIPNHKIGFMRGGNINNEVQTYKTGEDNTGVLDCIYTGFLPINIFNDNYVFPKTATIVNVQKFYNRTATVKFQRDHFLPTIHSMSMQAEDLIRFRFVLLDPIVTTYYVGIRYHYSGTAETGTVHIRDQSGANLPGGPYTLEKCTMDTNGTGVNQYKFAINTAKIIDFSKFPIKQLAIYSKNTVSINSLILFPTTPVVAA